MKMLWCALLVGQCVTAAEGDTVTALLTSARELNRKAQYGQAEKVYMTALANSNSTPVLVELSAFYKSRGDKELAKAFAMKAYNLNPENPETLKLAGQYEPGLVKLTALLKDYNVELGKLAERHPEPTVLESLEDRIAALHLERKWKKPFAVDDLPGTWEGQSGLKLGRMRAVLVAGGEGSYDGGRITWKFEDDLLTFGFNESVNGVLIPRKIIYKRQGDTFLFQEGARRNAVTLKRVGGS